MSDETNLTTLPIVPVKRTVLFPGVMMPVTIGRPRSIAAVEAASKSEDKTLLIVAQRQPDLEQPTQTDLYAIGTKAIIKQIGRTPDGQLHTLVQGVDRQVLIKLERLDPFLEGRVRPLSLEGESGAEADALHRAIIDLTGELTKLVQTSGVTEALLSLGMDPDPISLAYRVASLLNLTLAEEQALLEASTREDLLRNVYAALAREVQILQLRNKIASDAQEKIGKTQREYILREQLKAIQRELGEDEDEEGDVAELRRRIREADLPESVKKDAERELARLAKLPPSAGDHQVIRNYLELVLELPWKKSSEDSLELARVRQVLDEDHYGIKEVKERIVEHLAVLKLNPTAKAPILCLVGPPGVGKTSLGQSVARALGRKFERVSLGGVHDEAELRGHRRTYVGAMPGSIIQALRRAGVNNPVVMLDEVDKVGRDFRGDPAAALLEILDPAQNHTFRDHYLDLPFDLSKIMFITTANTLDPISQPLLDRMEVIRLPGYSEQEKFEIAQRYLWPRRVQEAGLKRELVRLSPELLTLVIARYTREAGVRQLEQQLGKLARKIALKIAESPAEQAESAIEITKEEVQEWLGTERFQPEEIRKELPPGVATGLAWTPTGGDVLYVETSLLPGSHDLTLTGQLGEVMQESARAARSYLWSHAEGMGLDISRFKRNGLHIHVPSGAIPKDGPSAGVTMATALASAYTGVPVRRDTAMTGEISLSGLVLPVGGIKEKVLAAHRAGITRVILPKANEKDLKEVPEEVHKAVQFILAERIDDVLRAAIEETGEAAAKKTGQAAAAETVEVL
ncbi:Lon protease [Nitrospira tepida]|uniref:Lon protease n=1 Tax=Nitrospira tepida TaxID=2973512 RepID=A0AA86MZG6_9BACT|nr:endopeptidase La [Nitrospira tepida]CAI4031918.1 Lon protease [Nitrospira tepida]